MKRRFFLECVKDVCCSVKVSCLGTMQRVVPCDPHRLAGLSICVTGFSNEERKRIQEAAERSGAVYCGDLRKDCTHLIAHLPEGPKYLAALKWGVHVVSEKWFWQSFTDEVCLDEEFFPDVSTITRSIAVPSVGLGSRQEVIAVEDQAPCSSPMSGNEVSTSMQQDLEASVDTEAGKVQVNGIHDVMYLSGCRIFLIGFEAAEMRRLVNLVRGGGGTRHMEMNESITHVILGRPPEREMKDIRQLAIWGAVYVLQSTWLEECSRQKKEVPTDGHLVPQNILLQGREQLGWASQQRSKLDMTTPIVPDKQSVVLSEVGQTSKGCRNPQQEERKDFTTIPEEGSNIIHNPKFPESTNAKIGLGKDLASDGPELDDVSAQWVPLPGRSDRNSSLHHGSEDAPLLPPSQMKGSTEVPMNGEAEKVVKHTKPLAENIFKGHVFGFSDGFPRDQRAELEHRVLEAGGVWEGEILCADYMLVPHGTSPVATNGSTVKHVSKHWISQCLEERKVLDKDSHVLFRPLPCQIPLAGFQGLKFCVSQYNDRDRRLLRRLCHVLKVKFTEIQNSKVTHLLCKAQTGEKYESAERLGIECVTADWLFSCVTQGKVIPLDDFRPRELTAADQEMVKSFLTQCPTQAAQVPSDTQTQGPSNYQAILLQRTTLETKATKPGTRSKGASGRGKSSANIRLSQSNAQATSCSLSSQAAGTPLDPWDANAPWVAEVGNSSTVVKPTQESTTQLRPAIPRPLTRSMKNGSSPLKASSPSERLGKHSPRLSQRTKPEDQVIGQSVAQRNVPLSSRQQESRANFDASDASRQELQKAVAECTRAVSVVGGAFKIATSAVCTSTLLQKDSQDGGSCGPNVVDAIEGLLRQTSKAMGDSLLEVMEVNQDLISSEPTTLSRRTREETHTHADFKKPKLYPPRSNKVEGEPKSPNPTPNQDDFLKFDESQIDSQMVAYDEDHSERQRIMEKVRTRSSTVALSNNSGVSRSSDKSAAAWKGDQKLGRLFKAAEANK